MTSDTSDTSEDTDSRLPREGEDTPPPIILAPAKGGEGAGVAVRAAGYEPSAAALGRSRRRRRFLRPLAVLAGVVLLALLAVAGFVVTARSVEVEVDPPPDRLAVSGGLVFELAGRYLVLPGSYLVEAEKAGYRRLETTLEINGDARQTYALSLEKLPGLLAIETLVGAHIEIDGEPVATAPTEPLELPPGEHEVAITAERHRPFLATVEIAGGGETTALEAPLEPAWAEVKVVSEPPGALLRIDGREVGPTPQTVELLEGRRGLALSLAGYKPRQSTVDVVAGEPRTLPTVRLVPADGNLTLTSEPSGAAVTVDGVYRGETPADLDLAPGRYMLRLQKAGYASAARPVEIDPATAREEHVVLEAEEGEVRLVVWPPDAEVRIDGEPATAGALRLTAVPHEIEVQKPGYAPVRRLVTPIPNLPQVIEVSLESLEVAKEKATPKEITTPAGQKLQLIEPGRFQMGASRREPGRRANEALREVELTRSYYLAVHEVTNAAFRRFRPEHASSAIGGLSLDGDDQPVVRVTWQDAAAYCNWLSLKEGLPPAYVLKDGKLIQAAAPMTTGYRLPTEAEWAWAARYEGRSGGEPSGGGPSRYAWGDDLPIPDGAGNFADVTAGSLVPGALSTYRDGHAATAPVGSFRPNGLGIHNLAGNVAEWVHDVYSIGVSMTGGVETDPAGPRTGEFHVIRGASYMDSTITELRLTFRDYGEDAQPDVGFRVARYLE